MCGPELNQTGQDLHFDEAVMFGFMDFLIYLFPLKITKMFR